MSNSNEKIGLLIQQIRQERGLTQSEFATKLRTSQSAVNRIEKGKQNLSLETLARISEVLQKQLIKVGSDGLNLRIEGGHELKGTVELKTSKNAAVALLCASLLNLGVTRFVSFPRIEEVYRIIEVLESIGVKVKWLENNDLEIRRPAVLKINSLNADAARKTRSVLMLIGPLMHELNAFKIPYAGGCKLGERTVAPHMYVLESFGVTIKSPRGHYDIHVKRKNPNRVVLYEQGNTVTNNALMAAAKTQGQTVIQSASADYMVQDLCGFLMKLGVKIEGFGTTQLRISGVQHIKKNITYAPTEDPIEAMFFLSTAITTNSKITISRVPIDWIALELLKLDKMGVKLHISEPYKARNGLIDLVDITVLKRSKPLQALEDKIHPNVWPGLNPDNLPYFVPIAAAINGRTLIHDWMFENRAIYYTEMSKVGMQVELADPHRLYIQGPTKFIAAEVVCPPALRPASLLLIGMLAAKGTSILRNVYTINRGYEDIAERLNKLGAKIAVLHDV
ncbi:UDP-N-acetylglucosamine 1-carboxyvinyltransferase [bacterium]|nr:UDP-N-acetylglucosamine 1-carboxyvinyltransferase [bacterium]NBX97683.1 UDP-N-acetylglucosamine 1-carboxyvinyltransferase [bacterium]NDC94505.1 UDP-N-acetylglucosamine 1-carboxyvinyltransferase [bacterium]NDD83153.1 UDP-N-acetylglucosamine 1-carboxyvinyltransferase [bacterium]NDG29612.1 UDP-N-acetylglucosamine 1-carboxyvinyltransferase [bacterium]